MNENPEKAQNVEDEVSDRDVVIDNQEAETDAHDAQAEEDVDQLVEQYREKVTDPFFTSVDTMKNDLMQILLDTVKQMPDVWQKMSQAKQDAQIQLFDQRITSAANKVARMIAHENSDYVDAKIGKITIKDPTNVEAVVKIIPNCDVSVLNMADQAVRICFLQTYNEQGHHHKADPDQPQLDLYSEGDMEGHSQQLPDGAVKVKSDDSEE